MPRSAATPPPAPPRPSPPRAAPGGEAVATVERGLTVLGALAAAPGGRLSRAELVRVTPLARATLDRVAATLVRLGHMRAEGNDLRLTPRVLEFGNAYLAASTLPGALGPHAHRLADELDESVSVAVPDRDGARFVIQCPRRRAMAVTFHIGDLLPAERCAPGALFAARWDEATWRRWRQRLAEDPHAAGFLALPPRRGPWQAPGAGEFTARVAEAREAGAAVDDQLVEPGLVAVALPVYGPDATLVAAVSVVSHTSRHTAASLAAHALPRLRACAATMCETLTTSPRGATVPAHPSAPAPAHPSAPVPAHPSAPAPAPTQAAALRAVKDEVGPGFLQSLARGLAVLSALRAPGGLTLSQVAAATGLSRATARRLLHALRHLGYVGAGADETRFAPLPRTLGLGFATHAGLTFERIATPHLAELVGRVHDSASIAVLDGTAIRYVARVAATRIMGVDLGVGARLPAYAAAMGRVLLAGLDRRDAADRLARSEPEPLTGRTLTRQAELTAALEVARRDGHALVDQELEEGLRSLAVPLHDRHGRVAAALNVAAHAAQRTPDELRTAVLPELRATARRIETDLAAATEYLAAEALTGAP
ncbi:helix-turn-helix domain-containing protein [Streptomyces tubbatahanensis]|uniref:Helix-turn-helix domain-containing protein n=1 Tax=Streptomyces tubbatahanensis TaxID=2923272 RepID=A0ABY3XZV3_9ACTN|nr:IclR family transcriptional regulator C-terminal domain-containing protein [Streptomyces tubbatahanensis]UNT00078.1 helix-turn-helix domain-containing protein [Streptomyces tubbatahanensis]